LVDPSLPSVVLVPDAEVPLPDIVAALQRLPRQVYVLLMPPLKQMAQLRTVAALAELFCQAIRSTVAPGPLVLAGVGAGGVVAHEMAVQMQRAGHEVCLLLLLPLLGPFAATAFSDCALEQLRVLGE
jgi:thioesterase domain-containing protein